MNEINSEIVIANVIKLIDFSNPENNKKKKDNKKGALVKKIRNKKQSDLETQLCYILNNNLENRPVVIQQSQENLEIQRENIRLLKRVNELEDIENKYNINLRRSREMREEIDELKNKIQTQINNIPTKPPPNFKPSTFDEELSSSEDDDIDYYEDNEDIKDVLKKKSIKRPDTSSEEEEDDIIKNLNKGLF